MNTVRAALGWLLILCTVGACTGKAAGTRRAQPAPVSSTIRVANNNWSDVTIYILRAGNRVRLGTVTSMGASVFRMPDMLLRSSGDVQLMVDPLGSRHVFVTPSIQFFPGQEIEFQVENHLPVSSVSVWE
jgi:hypothetical protein